jgi:hypothetical protein
VALAVWCGAGCGIDARITGEATGKPAGAPDATDPVATAADGCTLATTAGTFSNQAFPEQLAMFHVELDATPSASSIDGVIGLGDASATAFGQLAAIVRFNPAGTIDVRSGSTYRADLAWPYQAGTSYHLRIDIDVRTHTYSVWLRTSGSGYTALARSYPFRTEQAGVTRLNTVATEVDSTAGTLQLCGFVVVADHTTADGCVIATAGDGFTSLDLADASVLDTAAFTAQPSASNLDAVIGLSAGPATRFSDLATAVRFSPSGVLDARDGDSYRADASIPYQAGRYSLRMTADLTSHTYSVFQGTSGGALELARQYRFRTEQRAATHLDRLAVTVDGAQGSITVCPDRAQGGASTGVAFSREGSYAVLPVAGDQALLSDGATTTRVDAGGAVLASVARGGELASDVLGNIFIASVSGNTLSVDKYDPSFAPRWTATATVLAGATITAMSTDPTGAVRIGLVTPQEGTITVFSFTAGGAFASQLSASGNAVTLDGDEPIVAWNNAGTLTITRFAATGATRFSRAFTGQATITAMAVDPDHDVLFGGELVTPIDFGGGTLPTRSFENGPVNGFLVELSSTGDHVLSRRTEYSMVGGIASNGARIVVSSTERTQFRYEHLQSFDPAGAPVTGPSLFPGLGDNGFGDRVAIGASGRVWWNLETQWPFFPRWPYLVASAP